MTLHCREGTTAALLCRPLGQPSCCLFMSITSILLKTYLKPGFRPGLCSSFWSGLRQVCDQKKSETWSQTCCFNMPRRILQHLLVLSYRFATIFRLFLCRKRALNRREVMEFGHSGLYFRQRLHCSKRDMKVIVNATAIRILFSITSRRTSIKFDECDIVEFRR